MQQFHPQSKDGYLTNKTLSEYGLLWLLSRIKQVQGEVRFAMYPEALRYSCHRDMYCNV